MRQPSHTASLASAAYLEVGALPAAELEKILLRGEAPSIDAIVGWEWRGRNTQGWAKPAGIQKFIKGFFRAEAGEVYGYNQPVVQNRLDQPWIAKPSDVNPKRFGYFVVEPVDPTAKDNAYLNAILLDYGRGKNPRLDATQTLRDYVVRVNPGSDELLLGTAFVAVGPARVRVPASYFVLERHRPTSYRR